ncbi:hypothetical protein H180DRAFT_03299 [Streptomyces sp. WMMB 322]|nr:hypothetical protein H180DRAFT_03299 [Streptomyces sp. WMMB 322]
MEPFDFVNALSAVVSAVAAVVSAAVSVKSSNGRRRAAEAHRSGREEGMPPFIASRGRKLPAPGVRRLVPA